MGIYKIDAAEQEWRESWEPTLPLVAPSALITTPLDRSSELADGWEKAECHLEFMIRLVWWAVSVRGQGFEICPHTELAETVERVERLVLQVTNGITQIPRRGALRPRMTPNDNLAGTASIVYPY